MMKTLRSDILMLPLINFDPILTNKPTYFTLLFVIFTVHSATRFYLSLSIAWAILIYINISFYFNSDNCRVIVCISCGTLDLARYYSELNGVSVSVTISVTISPILSLSLPSLCHSHIHICSLTSAVRYSKMAALYTAAVAPTRPWLVVLFFKCLWILPTGNCNELVALARAFFLTPERDSTRVTRVLLQQPRSLTPGTCFLRVKRLTSLLYPQKCM